MLRLAWSSAFSCQLTAELLVVPNKSCDDTRRSARPSQASPVVREQDAVAGVRQGLRNGALAQPRCSVMPEGAPAQ